MDTLKVFTKALAFVSELTRVNNDPQINIYYKVMKKTPIGNEIAIKKHVNTFSNYIIKNENAILNKSIKDLTTDKIVLNDKVYLEIAKYFTSTNTDVMFQHLLLLLHLCKPSDNSKQKLIELSSNSSNSSSSSNGEAGENKFLSKYIKKMEEEYGDKEFTDPVNAAMSMMQSGMITNLIQDISEGVKSGELNPESLLSSVQSSFHDLTGNDISSIFNNGNISIPNDSGSSSEIDISSMMNMVSGMMSNMMPSNDTSGDSPMNLIGNLLGGLTSSTNSTTNGLDLDELEKSMSHNRLK